MLAVLLPLRALVTQEEVEDVLTEGFGDQFGFLHRRDGLIQRSRERIHAQCAPFRGSQAPHVVLGAGRQLVTLVDSLEPGGQQDRVRQIRIHSAVHRSVFDSRAVALRWFVHRHPNQRGAVVVTPADPRGCFSPTGEPLVGVHPLVGDRGDLRSVREQSGDEGTRDFRELEISSGLVERVAITFEQRQVRVHAAAGFIAEGLRHERGEQPLLHRDFLNHEPESHEVVGGGQGVRVPKVDLLLPRSAFVMTELDRDPHRFQGGDRLSTEVVGNAVRSVVEVAVLVDRFGDSSRARAFLEQVELDLGMGVEAETLICGFRQRPLENVTRIGVRG